MNEYLDVDAIRCPCLQGVKPAIADRAIDVLKACILLVLAIGITLSEIAVCVFGEYIVTLNGIKWSCTLWKQDSRSCAEVMGSKFGHVPAAVVAPIG